MIAQIAGVSQIQTTQLQNISQNRSVASDGKFGDFFGSAVEGVALAEKNNSGNFSDIITGDISKLAEAMIGVVEADLSLQFTMQVRNKIVEAYKEIMSMQV